MKAYRSTLMTLVRQAAVEEAQHEHPHDRVREGSGAKRKVEPCRLPCGAMMLMLSPLLGT